MSYSPIIGFPHFGGLSLTGSGGSETPTISGLIPLPGINGRGMLVLTQSTDYAYADGTAVVIAKGADDLWPDLTGATLTLTLSIDGASATAAGTVITATGDDAAARFDIARASLAAAGRGVYSVTATLSGGHVWTCELGELRILKRV